MIFCLSLILQDLTHFHSLIADTQQEPLQWVLHDCHIIINILWILWPHRPLTHTQHSAMMKLNSVTVVLWLKVVITPREHTANFLGMTFLSSAIICTMFSPRGAPIESFLACMRALRASPVPSL